MPSSQDKVAWTNIALSWNFLWFSTALWRNPRFIWKKQNGISTTIIGIPANPRPTQHWLRCTSCNHEAILDTATSTQSAPQSGWECELIVLYSDIQKSHHHYCNFHPFLWHLQEQIQAGCRPVVAVWCQCCSSPYSWAPQGQDVVPGQWLLMMQYLWVAIRARWAIWAMEDVQGIHFPLWPWDSALGHWRQSASYMESSEGHVSSCTVRTHSFLIVLLQVTHLSLIPLGTLI